LIYNATAWFAPVVAMIIAGLPSSAAPQATVRNIEVEGTTFRITLSEGHVLRQDELPGVRLVIGDGSGKQRTIRIDTVELDRKDSAGEIVLYGLSEQDPIAGTGEISASPTPRAAASASRSRALLPVTAGTSQWQVDF
jgi:hypothetical protein